MSRAGLHDLLAWSTANTAANSEPAVPAQQPPRQLDPAILDAILGRTDAVRMRECLDICSDMKNPLDDRMRAWDELEMILESLDNANDLQPLGLWPKIIAQLSSSEDESIVQALWTQNNPKAKEDFLRQDPLPTLVSLLRSSSSDVRSKALYCLGALLKHDDVSLLRFGTLGGWIGMEGSLRDPSLPCRRKATFLIGALMVDTSTVSTVRRAVQEPPAPILSALIASLSTATAQPTGINGDGEGFDEDVAESSMRALRALGLSSLSPENRQAVAQAVQSGISEFGLTTGEKAEALAELAVPP